MFGKSKSPGLEWMGRSKRKTSIFTGWGKKRTSRLKLNATTFDHVHDDYLCWPPRFHCSCSPPDELGSTCFFPSSFERKAEKKKTGGQIVGRSTGTGTKAFEERKICERVTRLNQRLPRSRSSRHSRVNLSTNKSNFTRFRLASGTGRSP